jgi:hypothetical protein
VRNHIRISKEPSVSKTFNFTWKEESAGKEIWRIGIPDKTSGEFKHGRKPSNSSELQPEEYRLYWAQHDFESDFPNGVDFKVGESDYAEYCCDLRLLLLRNEAAISEIIPAISLRSSKLIGNQLGLHAVYMASLYPSEMIIIKLPFCKNNRL